MADADRNKPYCEDCESKCYRECVTCHKPYPSERYFLMSETRCNSCQKRHQKAAAQRSRKNGAKRDLRAEEDEDDDEDEREYRDGEIPRRGGDEGPYVSSDDNSTTSPDAGKGSRSSPKKEILGMGETLIKKTKRGKNNSNKKKSKRLGKKKSDRIHFDDEEDEEEMPYVEDDGDSDDEDEDEEERHDGDDDEDGDDGGAHKSKASRAGRNDTGVNTKQLKLLDVLDKLKRKSSSNQRPATGEPAPPKRARKTKEVGKELKVQALEENLLRAVLSYKREVPRASQSITLHM